MKKFTILKQLSEIRMGFILLFSFILFAVTASSVFQSCQSDRYYEADLYLDRTVEINAFKNSMKNAGVRFRNSSNGSLSNSAKSPVFNEKDFVLFIYPDALELIKAYGISEAELIQELGSLDPAKLDLIAQTIVAEESYLQEGQTMGIFNDEDFALQFISLAGNSVYAQSNVGNCILEATGINSLIQLGSGSLKKLGKKGVMKIVGKVASKYLGAIGTAIAVLDFADCMGWFD
ncbi:hypothetical protein [Halpernia sp.]|uniref:hypothetical protein n=1 Tax=Halpernia sp. TaxID=2782209 RepID=UPI003A938862